MLSQDRSPQKTWQVGHCGKEYHNTLCCARDSVVSVSHCPDWSLGGEGMVCWSHPVGPGASPSLGTLSLLIPHWLHMVGFLEMRLLLCQCALSPILSGDLGSLLGSLQGSPTENQQEDNGQQGTYGRQDTYYNTQ